MRIRLIPLFPLLAVFPLAIALAEGNAVDPRADCTFNPQAFHSPREVWRNASRNAELVAPSIQSESVASGRRHASNPPSLGFIPRNFIDTEIFGKMMRDGVVWTGRSGDEEFLRRVSLDLTGQIPDPATVKSFLADPAADKRDRMIDTLIASDGFTDRWTMWFGDLVQNVQVASNSNEDYQARNAYYAYIHSSFAANKPYDQMVRELISGSGGGFTNGEADYWVRQMQNNGPIQDTYDNLSAQTGQQFLGMYLQCLSCHGGFGHLEQVNTWLVKKTRYDFWKNAAFFAQVATQAHKDPATNNTEIVLSENKAGSYKLNTNSGNKTPRIAPAGQPAVVDPGFILTGETPGNGENRRDAYGRMLTAHPQFARATVNYVWKAIFGVGIVEPATPQPARGFVRRQRLQLPHAREDDRRFQRLPALVALHARALE
jgi:cytochrome oxidase Cu insertion factor (SCO1/SenC/PrrC family)